MRAPLGIGIALDSAPHGLGVELKLVLRGIGRVGQIQPGDQVSGVQMLTGGEREVWQSRRRKSGII